MRFGIIFVLFLVLASTFAVNAAEETVFAEIFDNYEAIRQELIADSTKGVASHAEAIATAARSLADDFSAEAAGVDRGDAASVEGLLPEIQAKAEQLAAAEGIAEVRQGFAALTQPLTRWDKVVQGPRPIVVYCPMEKKAWLQPDEAIGNPYAPNMLRCGEVVQR